MKKKVLSLLLTVLLLAGCILSCASKPEKTEEPLSSVADTTEAETDPPAEEVYAYPEQGLDGRTFTILNLDSYWGMHLVIDPDETIGESLNDAMFERTQLVESKLNCVIRDDRLNAPNDLYATTEAAQKEILGGESIHDVMYIRDDHLVNFFSQGLLTDLNLLDGLQLDKPWWDGRYNSAAQIGESIFGAAGDAHLMAYDSSWCIFFNEAAVKNNGLDLPYDLAREGKWTIDRLWEYCEGVANVDATSRDWKNGGNALYGLVYHFQAPDKFIFAADVDYVSKENGDLTLTLESERFYSIVEKIASMFSDRSVTLKGDTDDFNPNKGYVYTFMNQYAAFLTAEVKTANNIRDMEATFGILPFPKYDEAQEEYRTPLMFGLLVMAIPVTCKDSAATATVMDALAYESNRTVVPVYFDQTVAHKGLRNEESVEMLQIMRDSRSVDIAVVYGWNTSLAEQIRSEILKGNSNVSSIVASEKNVVQNAMEEFLKQLSGEE